MDEVGVSEPSVLWSCGVSWCVSWGVAPGVFSEVVSGWTGSRPWAWRAALELAVSGVSEMRSLSAGLRARLSRSANLRFPARSMR